MKKTEWILKASKLATKLGEKGNDPAGKKLAKSYFNLSKEIYPKSTHHIADSEASSSLLRTVQKWITKARAGDFDKCFK